MPLQKSPECLYRLCITRVAGRIRRLCSDHELFADGIPWHVNEDLVEEVCSKQNVRLKSLLHLLTHDLGRVKLRIIDAKVAVSILHPISLHGARLSELSLELTAYLRYDDVKGVSEGLTTLISHLPELRRLTLELHCIPIGNETLVAIAHNCPKLIELSLRAQGIQHHNDGLKLLVQCRDLVSLTLTKTGNSNFRVATFVHLLNGLPQLRHMPFLDMRKVFPQLPDTSRLRLAKLDLGWNWRESLLSRKELDHVVKICPHLTDLTFGISKLGDDTKVDVPAMDEEGPVKSPLEPVGINLTRLQLFVDLLDIRALARCCPGLVELRLRLGKLIIHKSPLPFGFPRLRTSEFNFLNEDYFSPAQLVEILRLSTDLEDVKIQTGKLTDSEMLFLISSGTLSKVRRLTLLWCYELTTNCLMEVVATLRNLAMLQLSWMERADFHKLKKFAEDQHLQVEIFPGGVL